MNKTLQFVLITFFAITQQNAIAQWTQIGNDIDGVAATDQSGWSVSLSDDGLTMAIGARENDGNGSNSGHVRIYKNTTGSWVQQGSDIGGEAINDLSGESVSLSGDGLTVAIGASSNDGNGSNSGHVRVYTYTTGTWVQQGTDIDGEAVDDLSGSSISLSSDGLTVAIGSRWNDDGGGLHRGHVRIYKYLIGAWVQQGNDIDGDADSDYLGHAVSLSSDGLTVAIGATGNDDNGSNSGQVRIYKYTTGTWMQQGGDINGEAAEDQSGWSVSLSSDGSTVAIGAKDNDDNGSGSGHVRIYKYTTGTWMQQGDDIDGEAAGDGSGFFVSLSSDGTTVAIGAPSNDGNGSNSGHVRIYKNMTGTWVQQGSDIDGEADGDFSARVISLSGDGSTVAIGAIGNDDNGNSSGHARVFEFSITLVTSITVQGQAGATTITTTGGTLQMEATVLPANADDQTYTWSVVNGTGSATISTSGLLTALTDGTVTVTATANDGSGVTGTAVITISNQSVGVREQAAVQRLSIYPNPANAQLFIDFDEHIKTVVIFDITGKTIKTIRPLSNTIDVSDLSNGIYFLQIQTHKGMLSSKFIKK